jgi:hypothetical protein
MGLLDHFEQFEDVGVFGDGEDLKDILLRLSSDPKIRKRKER